MEYGSSLLVPSVQELVKEPIITVPSRYIRPDQYDKTSNKIISVSEIPVINFQNLLCHGELSESELASLHSACRDWGFFQLINHGISSSLVEKIKTDIQDFFNLPMEEKKKLWQHSGEVEGFGQAFVKSEEQKLDWNDIFFLTTLPVSLRKPHLFPKLPTPFRDNLETYALELKNLAKAIISQMEKALEIKGKEMTRMFEDGMQAMRMNYYPPCPQPEQVIGLTPHSDSVGLTILLQISEVEGLQIKKDGMWVPVKPLPNYAFVVNIGDILEIVTNGIYRSIEHRATVDSEKERLSIATFYNPNVDAQIGPVNSLITEETPALYRTLECQEYFKGLFARKLDGKAYIDAMKLDSAEH